MCLCGSGRAWASHIQLFCGPGRAWTYLLRAGPGPHNSICGPGPGRGFTTAAGRAWASNHICGPGLGLDFRPVQDNSLYYYFSSLTVTNTAVRTDRKFTGELTCCASSGSYLRNQPCLKVPPEPTFTKPTVT